METFAKLFQHEKYGQILVLLDQDDEGAPCVKYMALPPGLWVCAISITFKDDAKARETFEASTLEQASAGVAEMWKYSEPFQG